MITVNIATLKAKLSYYLGQVKQGNEVLVLDRKTPVARMVPSGGREHELVITGPKHGPQALKKLRYRPLRHKTDVVAMLVEERSRR